MKIDSQLLSANGVASAASAPKKVDAKTGLDERETKRLQNACKDFEALFLTNLLKAMRKTIQKTDLFGTDSGEETFQEMMDVEIGKSAAKTSSMGIADVLYRQLTAELARKVDASQATDGIPASNDRSKDQ